MTEQSKAPLKAIAAAIKRHREAAGLSLTEAARRAQIAKSTLSQLESGVGNPSVETLWALALALDVSFTDLVDPPRAGVVIMRAGEGEPVRSEHSDYAITLLAHAPAGSRRDLYKLAAEPGPARESEPHTPGTIEHVILTAGSAKVGPSGSPATLHAGDYISYPGDAPHVFEALEAGTTAVMIDEHR